VSKCPCARAVAGTGGRYVGSSIVLALLARRWILHSDILFLSLLRDASAAEARASASIAS